MKNSVRISKKGKTVITNKSLPDYLNYSPSQDIYNNYFKKIAVNQEDISKTKYTNTNHANRNEKMSNVDKLDDDIDTQDRNWIVSEKRFETKQRKIIFIVLGGTLIALLMSIIV